MRRRPVQIELSPRALAIVRAAARRSHPTETGGLLLGWWDSGRIVVDTAAEVLDETATSSRWHRREVTAQQALDEVLKQHEDPWLGYVGDWHTHPAPSGPSYSDIAALRRSSQQYPDPLVLLVHRQDSQIDLAVAQRGRRRPPQPSTVKEHS